MKKLIILILILIVGKFSFGQAPVTQFMGSPSTDVRSWGVLSSDSSLTVRTNFSDTSLANIGWIKNIAGTIIRAGGTYWYRNSAATAWVEFSSSAGGVNIYNSDGILTGDRTLYGDNRNLDFTDIGTFTMNADRVSLNTYNSALVALQDSSVRLSGDTIALNAFNENIVTILKDSSRSIKRISYTSNLGSTFTRHTLVDKNYVDSLKNIIPTLQQVLATQSNSAVITSSTDISPSTTGLNFILGNNGLWNDITFQALNNATMQAQSVSLSTSNSTVTLDLDSLKINPFLGRINIDSLRTASDTTEYKPLVIGKYNRSVRELDYWPGGSGSSSSATLIPQDSVYNQNVYSEQSSWINTNIFQQQTSSFFAGGYRDGASVLNVGDTIYFYGGWTSPATVYDSVYYSVDGGVTKTYVGLAPWGAMHSFAMFKTDNGFYFKIGGDYLSTTAQKLGVWRTRTPGVMASWTQVGTLPSRPRILYDAIELNGVLYTGGGQYTVNWSEGATDTIWKSVDNGVNWTYHSSGSGYFDKNISHTWVKRGGRVYQVAGGQYDEGTSGNRTYDKTVISTTDFSTYRVEESIPSAGVQYPSVVLWDSKIWCLAGYDGSGNVSNVNYLDKGGRWHVAANYDSALTVVTPTHAAAITTWKDRIVLMNGNLFNKTYWVNRSRFITAEARPKFITTPLVDSLLSESNLFIGSTYSGSPESYIRINPTTGGGEVQLSKKLVAGTSTMTFGSTGSAAATMNWRNNSDALGYLEYSANAFDLYHNNSLYWRFMYDGTMRLKSIASGLTPSSGYGALYVKSNNNFYFKNTSGAEVKLNGGSSLTVNTTDVGNVGTGVDNLITYSVPSNTLFTDGDYIEFSFTFTFATNANNKTVKVVYGATEIYTSTAQPQNDGSMEVKGKIIRTSATTQKIIVTATTDGTLFTDLANYTTAAETLSGAVTLKATGEATSDNDIINRILVVKYFPNN